MMNLVSEKLLKDEIDKLDNKENLTSDEKICLSIYKRELMTIRKLMIEELDMTGSIEEFESRLKDLSIYFINKEEYDTIINKAKKYDEIVNILRNIK